MKVFRILMIVFYSVLAIVTAMGWYQPSTLLQTLAFTTIVIDSFTIKEML